MLLGKMMSSIQKNKPPDGAAHRKQMLCINIARPSTIRVAHKGGPPHPTYERQRPARIAPLIGGPLPPMTDSIRTGSRRKKKYWGLDPPYGQQPARIASQTKKEKLGFAVVESTQKISSVS